MPRSARLELTPYPRGKCWKKFRKGVVYYLGKGVHDWRSGFTGKNSSHPAYIEALSEWRWLLAKLEHDEALGRDTSSREYQAELREWRRLPLLDRGWSLMSGPQRQPRFLPAVPQPVEDLPARRKKNGYVAPPIQVACPSGAAIQGRGIPDLIRSYLAIQLGRVQTKQISPQHYAELRGKLEYFQAFAEHNGMTHTEHLTVPMLQKFRSEQDFWVAHPDDKDGCSVVTAAKRLRVVKVWLLWLEQMKIYEVPAYVMKDFTKISPPKTDHAIDAPKGNPVFSVDEIREIYTATSARARLYILFGLNCAFTQVDISTLRPEHIVEGFIDRKRHKTGHRKNGARQRVKLWPETIELIRRFAKPEGGELLFLTADGLPLVRREVLPSGRYRETDSIRLAFARAMRAWIKPRLVAARPELFEHPKRKTPEIRKRNAIEIKRLFCEEIRRDGRTFKVLRKTSANMLEQSAEYRDLVETFLAHSDRRTARFYTNPPFERLAEATDWLREQFRLFEIE